MCIDLHAAQIQGFFDLPVDHLTASPVLLEHFRKELPGFVNPIVLSPDVGNAKTANMFAEHLGIDLAIIEKRRQSGSEVKVKNVIGEVKGRSVIMFDDMITTAGTVVEAAKVARERGATSVHLACTHAVMVGQAIERLSAPEITSITVTDTIPIDNRLNAIRHKLRVLSVASMLGEAIHRIHHNQSVSALFGKSFGPAR